jgi:hypothetical protein
MPTQPLLPGSGRIPEGLPSIDRDSWPAPVRSFMAAVTNAITGLLSMFRVGLTFGTGANGTKAGHFDGQWLEFTIPIRSGVPTISVPHGLGRVPFGFIVVDMQYLNTVFPTPTPVLVRDITKGWTTDMVHFRVDSAPNRDMFYRILLLAPPNS